jgi:hypothetical protein
MRWMHAGVLRRSWTAATAVWAAVPFLAPCTRVGYGLIGGGASAQRSWSGSSETTLCCVVCAEEEEDAGFNRRRRRASYDGPGVSEEPPVRPARQA